MQTHLAACDVQYVVGTGLDEFHLNLLGLGSLYSLLFCTVSQILRR